MVHKYSKVSRLTLNLIFFCAVCFFSSNLYPETLQYNFFYSLRGHNHGRILFIIPYRAYYESFASVNFTASRQKDNSLNFYFNEIPEPGYMMRTSGFSGRALVILTAGSDLKKSLDFSKLKLADFYKIAPYYSRFIKKKRAFLFKFFSDSKNSIRFKRDPWGKHSDFFIDFKLRFQYYPEILNIDFNIYKILLEMLKLYNHPFTTVKGVEQLVKNPSPTWQSPALDYSPNLNRTVRLAARVMKRLRGFRQEHDFKLDYKIRNIDPYFIQIQGSKQPDLKMWGKFSLKSFLRRIKVRREDNVLIEDTIIIQIRNPKGNGLNAHLSLKLIEK